MSNTYGELLRDIREAHGDNQKQCAERIGMTPAYLCFIEKGKRRVPERVTSRLIEVYNLGQEEVRALYAAAIEQADKEQELWKDKRLGFLKEKAGE